MRVAHWKMNFRLNYPARRLLCRIAAVSYAVTWSAVGVGEDSTRADAQVCGANSLALAAAYVADIHASDIYSLLSAERAPFSLGDLEDAARKAGLRSSVLRWKNKEAARFHCPAILHVRGQSSSTQCDHFIVCFGESEEFLCVADYPRPPTLVPRDHVFEYWEGDALYVDDATGRRITHLQINSQDFTRQLALVAIAVCVVALAAIRGVAYWRRQARLDDI